MAINLPQILLGTLWFSVGLLLAWIFPYMLGNVFLALFSPTSSFYFIFTAGQWLLYLFFGFILPLMMLQDKTIADKAIKFVGG